MRSIVVYGMLGFLFCTCVTIQAQNTRLEKAFEEFHLKNYTGAVKQFSRLLNNEKDTVMIDSLNKYLGICHDEMNQYKQAIQHYNSYLASHPKDSEIKSSLAEMYLTSGNIQQSLRLFKELHASDTTSDYYERMIESCHFALFETNKPNKPIIKNQELINSRQSEFGLAFYEGQLIFASHRVNDEFSSIHGRINQGYSNLYSAEYDSSLEMYKHPYPLDGKINSQFNEGTFTFLDSLNLALFTRCSKNPDLCMICKAKMVKDEWDFISVVDLGNEQYNFAHPTITADGSTLYFASDLPGGAGGNDIWKAPVSPTGKIGEPENIGNSVNTPGDEMFPFVVGDSILLFASDGHVGMGGLDIYFSKIEDGLYDRPVNVGAPINSTGDDFSILLNDDLGGGYFCSNRENETRSDDIYSFYHNIFLKDIYGSVVDSVSFESIADVKIVYSTDGIDRTITYTDSLGKFFIPNSAHVNCGSQHKLQLEKEGYLTKSLTVPCHAQEDTVILMNDGEGICHPLAGLITNKRTGEPVQGATISIRSLRGLNTSTQSIANGNYNLNCVQPDDYLVLRVSRNNYLSDSKVIPSPNSESKVVTMNPGNGFDTHFELVPIEFEVEFEIENIYYEFDKARLLPASEFSLNKLVNLLRENPQIRIQINSHADERGSDSYNQRLSQRRGQSVVNYLVDAGISRSRLLSKGYGESRPVIANAQTEADHQKNRRTAFEIIGEINVAASGSGALYKIPGSKTNTDEELFKRIQEAGKKDGSISEESLLGLKINAPSDNKLESEEEQAIETQTNPGSTVYRVQLVATSRPIDVRSNFPEIVSLLDKHKISVETVDNLYKYQLGEFKTRNQAEQLRFKLKQAGHKNCFIVKIN